MPVTLTQSLLDELLAEANSAISHPPIQYVGVDPRVLVALCEIALPTVSVPVYQPDGSKSLISKDDLL